MRKIYLFLLLTVVCGSSVAQHRSEDEVVIDEKTFPDENFRTWLLNQTYGRDGILTPQEIEGVSVIAVDEKEIQSLEGIKVFSSLRNLSCNKNQITSLDLSGNSVIESIFCHDNQLTDLNVFGCRSLKNLYCYENQLGVLDLSGCTNIYEVECYRNRLTSLNVAGCSAMHRLDCANNNLESLDISSCTKIWRLICYDNLFYGQNMDGLIERLPKVEGEAEIYIKVCDQEYRDHNICMKEQVKEIKSKGWSVKYHTDGKWWDYEGSNPEDSEIIIDEKTFPDKNFRTWLLNQAYGRDAILTPQEIEGVSVIAVDEKEIQSLEGIKVFSSLRNLSCNKNQITSLDLSGNSVIESISCHDNQLAELNVFGCASLKNLYCYENQLDVLDLSGCTNIYEVECYRNRLTSLNVAGCSAMHRLDCGNNSLKSLDISSCTKIWRLICYDNLFYGQNMDGMIECLPKVETEAEIYIKVYDQEYQDQNEYTCGQVNSIISKGWTVKYHIDGKWLVATGVDINAVDCDINAVDDTWHTLQGTRIDYRPSKSGIYIHNGNKVMIK